MEESIDKVFSIHDFQVYTTSTLHRKEIDMEVSQVPKVMLPIPTLILPDNMACFLTVRKAIMELISDYGWNWDQALKYTCPSTITMRIIDLKNSIHN